MKKHNFNPGPAVLPQSTLDNSSKAVRELDGKGVSLLEISHRSEDFVNILEEARSLVKEVLEVPSGYSVLFLQGGARLQFAMIPYNLLDEEDTAAFVDTGNWSQKAITEVEKLANAKVVASSEDQDYSYIPDNFDTPEDAKYLHITSNNTIRGTQWKYDPDVDIPVVADMSSDIFSRPIDVSKYDLIYAGAQKNLGPAGATLVIVKEDMLGKVERDIPTMLDYQKHIGKDSALNTPPVFSIYGCLQTLKWIQEQGGVEEIEKYNRKKADVMYQAIDENPLFEGTAQKEYRSLMNATFVATEEGITEDFLKAAAEENIMGIKGHRSVGGFRASMYNALKMEDVEALTELMNKFAQQHTQKTVE